MNFFRNFYGSALKGNPYLRMSVLTGVVQIPTESLFSGLNNLSVNSVLSAHNMEAFGFTEGEVKKMLEYYGLTDQMDSVNEWYDGYRFGNFEIYNPWSVPLSCSPFLYMYG